MRDPRSLPPRLLPLALALGLSPTLGETADLFPSIDALSTPDAPTLAASTPGGFPSNAVLRGQNVSLSVEGFKFGGGIHRGENGKPTGNGVEIVPQEWAGSGFLVDEDGTLVTNFHVAARALKINARFDDGATFAVNHLTVYDPEHDLAVVKIAARRTFSPVRLGDSDHVEPRDAVLAVGNPGDTGLNITEGSISQVRRDRDGAIDLLQHTASIAPGSSGGALYRGQEVIGVNVSRLVGASFYQAVPINRAKALLSRDYKPDPLTEVFDPIKAIQSGKLKEIGSVLQRVPGRKNKRMGEHTVEASLAPLGDYCLVLKNAAKADLDLLVRDRRSDQIIGLGADSDKTQEIVCLTLENGAEVRVHVLNNSSGAVPFALTLNKINW